MNGILDWMVQHANLISALASTATFFLWMAYAKMFHKEFKRKRRPRLLINQALGGGLSSICVLSNMSEESIQVERVMMKVENPEEQWVVDLTDYSTQFSQSQVKHSGERDWRRETLQGPLSSGSSRLLGSFREFLSYVVEWSGQSQGVDGRLGSRTVLASREASRYHSVEIRVIAVYVSEDLPVGASRTFYLQDDHEVGQSIRPAEAGGTKMFCGRRRNQVHKWLKEMDNSAEKHSSARRREKL